MKNNEVIKCQKALSDLEKKYAEELKKETGKSKDINQIERSITKSITPNSLLTKQQQILRLRDDLSRIQIKKAEISKKIAEQSERLFKAKNELAKEEEKERKRIIELDKKRKQEQLNHQRLLTSELRTQFGLQNSSLKISTPREIKYDIFISHASEDKEAFVKPLVIALQSKGIKVWYDEFTLKIGDSLRRSIDNGLINSTYGVVILSNAFFSKNWTQYELDGLVNREMDGRKVILPIWHLVTKDQVQSYSPSLADKVALNSSINSMEEIVTQLYEIVGGQ
jgi:hypothetical protein